MQDLLAIVDKARMYSLHNDNLAAIEALGFEENLPVRCLLADDIKNDLNNSKIFPFISQKNSDFIFGRFSCPYHPYLNLELCMISEVLPSLCIDQSFSSIRCVKQLEGTKGISHPQVVAIFPENFRGRQVLASDPVYYFVNKFAHRHITHTRPFISHKRMSVFFRKIISLNEEEIYPLIANWVHIHELSHRKGLMPLPTFLKEKSGKFSAALEELRADLHTIEFCLKNLAKKDAELTALYVFCERLFAYPLFRAKNNFDTISSVFMWKFLNESEFFERPSLSRLEIAIELMIKHISAYESAAMGEQDSVLRRIFLNNKVSEYLNDYDLQFQSYTKFMEFL